MMPMMIVMMLMMMMLMMLILRMIVHLLVRIVIVGTHTVEATPEPLYYFCFIERRLIILVRLGGFLGGGWTTQGKRTETTFLIPVDSCDGITASTGGWYRNRCPAISPVGHQ